MVKSDDVVFKLGDTVTVFLTESTVIGCLIREDQMGITIQDAKEKTKYRFIPWDDRVIIIEYQKGVNSVEKR